MPNLQTIVTRYANRRVQHYTMKKDAVLFATGGIIYPALEIASRGYSDVSMSIAGGVCLCLINRFCNGPFKKKSLSFKCCVGSGIITSVEFLTGIVVNVLLKQNVWDYSNLPLNVLGQVCLPFSILWFFITIPALGLCGLYDKIKGIPHRKRIAK